MFPYSYYSTTKEGLKIEMLYRKVGEHVWYKAFNTEAKPVVLLDILPDTPVSVSRALVSRGIGKTQGV